MDEDHHQPVAAPAPAAAAGRSTAGRGRGRGRVGRPPKIKPALGQPEPFSAPGISPALPSPQLPSLPAAQEHDPRAMAVGSQGPMPQRTVSEPKLLVSLHPTESGCVKLRIRVVRPTAIAPLPKAQLPPQQPASAMVVTGTEQLAGQQLSPYVTTPPDLGKNLLWILHAHLMSLWPAKENVPCTLDSW